MKKRIFIKPRTFLGKSCAWLGSLAVLAAAALRATQGFFEHLRDIYGSAQAEFSRIDSGFDFSGEFIALILCQ